jgi:aconitate hydratase 2/2-methylisocitrate dehydratase
MSFAKDLDSMGDELYRYLNFNEIANFQKAADDTKVKFKNITVTVAA